MERKTGEEWQRKARDFDLTGQGRVSWRVEAQATINLSQILARLMQSVALSHISRIIGGCIRSLKIPACPEGFVPAKPPLDRGPDGVTDQGDSCETEERVDDKN